MFKLAVCVAAVVATIVGQPSTSTSPPTLDIMTYVYHLYGDNSVHYATYFAMFITLLVIAVLTACVYVKVSRLVTAINLLCNHTKCIEFVREQEDLEPVARLNMLSEVWDGSTHPGYQTLQEADDHTD